MIDPLRISFEVACPAKHAFDIWTDRIDSWWPRDHSGWEKLGEAGPHWRDLNRGGWGGVLPHFIAAAELAV